MSSSSSPISLSSPTRASTPPPISSFSDEDNSPPLVEATQQCVFNTLSQMSSSSSSSMTHSVSATAITPSCEEDIDDIARRATSAVEKLRQTDGVKRLSSNWDDLFVMRDNKLTLNTSEAADSPQSSVHSPHHSQSEPATPERDVNFRYQNFSDEESSIPGPDAQLTFINETFHLPFTAFPNKQTIAEHIQLSWINIGNIPITFLIPCDTTNYIFKIEENGAGQLRLSGIRTSVDGTVQLPLCDLTNLRLGKPAGIDDIMAHLTPLFVEENQSEDNFFRALQASLFALPDNHFALDYSEEVVKFLSNTETIGGFESFPTDELFGKRLRTLWAMSQGEEACLFFRAHSNKFYLKFSKKDGDRLHCDILCGHQWISSTAFESIETAIHFFKILLPSPSDSGDTVKQKEGDLDGTAKLLQIFIKLQNAQILPIMLSIATLYEMGTAVQSEDPKALGYAFKQLQELTLPTVLRIGSENRTTTVGALALFYLTTIQSNTTPESIKDVPLYPGKAFLKIDGCSSTPEERQLAVDYAWIQVALDVLEWSLEYKGPNSDEIRNDLFGAVFESPHLASMQFSFSQSTEQNLKAIAQKRQEIRDQLGLG